MKGRNERRGVTRYRRKEEEKERTRSARLQTQQSTRRRIRKIER